VFINQRERGIIPILMKIFELKFIIEPMVAPISNSIMIDIFIKKGKKKICVGNKIHISILPINNEKGVMINIGISINLLFV
jgi:hypothetical protein